MSNKHNKYGNKINDNLTLSQIQFYSNMKSNTAPLSVINIAIVAIAF